MRQSHVAFGMNLTHFPREGRTPDPEVDSCMLWRLYHQATPSRVLHFHSLQTPLTTFRCTRSWPSSRRLLDGVVCVLPAWFLQRQYWADDVHSRALWLHILKIEALEHMVLRSRARAWYTEGCRATA